MLVAAILAACSQYENQATSSAAVVPAASAATTSSNPVALTTENHLFLNKKAVWQQAINVVLTWIFNICIPTTHG